MFVLGSVGAQIRGGFGTRIRGVLETRTGKVGSCFNQGIEFWRSLLPRGFG